jgi:UDP-N-acetylenolpyruvoylglucosamine reductase
MNAGTALGEIASIVKSVNIVDNNLVMKIRVRLSPQDSFSYRKNHFVNEGDIIIGATFFHPRSLILSIPQKIKDYLDSTENLLNLLATKELRLCF